jgi:hypothetical protein
VVPHWSVARLTFRHHLRSCHAKFAILCRHAQVQAWSPRGWALHGFSVALSFPSPTSPLSSGSIQATNRCSDIFIAGTARDFACGTLREETTISYLRDFPLPLLFFLLFPRSHEPSMPSASHAHERLLTNLCCSICVCGHVIHITCLTYYSSHLHIPS